MAKNKKELFKSTLSAKKPSDERIEAVTNEITNQQSQKEKGFYIKFPQTDYDKLDSVSKKTHIPKKYIIIEALNAYYNENGH